MDQRAKDLIQQGDFLFRKKAPLDFLLQEIADNFYPERADFTSMRNLGEDFAVNLTTSYPILARRELGSSISSMLRPTDKEWMKMTIAREDKLDNTGRAWLESKTKIMKRAMYDPLANFVRSTKEGDNDFAAFGQCCISTETNRLRNRMLYRCWHLRDMAWCENAEGQIDTIHRKWMPTARDLQMTFGADKLHPKVKECVSGETGKDPYTQINVRHIVLPSEYYDAAAPDGRRFRTPFVSIYVDVENEHIIEEIGVYHKIYSIPRWQTVSGSQYAYSPCTVAALPDARLIQAITLTLLEAGEKAANPPMLAQQNVIRGDISVYAGGVTWADPDYDERLGEALRPIAQDYSGLPIGMEMQRDIRQTIMEAFYLNKINLPQVDRSKMTAYEVGQRIQEYIRNALPLFEPMESDYNGQVCSDTFEVMMRAGAFGAIQDIPQSLRGHDVQFKFESPLHDAAEKQKGHTFIEAKAMLAEAVALDPSVATMIKAKDAIRDVLKGIGTPAEWMASEEEMAEAEANGRNQEKIMQTLEAVQTGAAAAEQAGKAGMAMAQMGMGT